MIEKRRNEMKWKKWKGGGGRGGRGGMKRKKHFERERKITPKVYHYQR